jgi:hypothetical protein
METDPVPEKLLVENSQKMKSMQNMSHVHCNTPSSETLKLEFLVCQFFFPLAQFKTCVTQILGPEVAKICEVQCFPYLNSLFR